MGVHHRLIISFRLNGSHAGGDIWTLHIYNSAYTDYLPYNTEWSIAGLSTPIQHASGYASMGPNGQCVDFVKHMTNTSGWLSTASWRRGDKVSAYWDPSALVGKPIATFTSSGRYGPPPGSAHNYGYAAIIISAWREFPSNTVTHAWVIDMNWTHPNPNAPGGTISKHVLKIGGSDNANLNNYYTIKY